MWVWWTPLEYLTTIAPSLSFPDFRFLHSFIMHYPAGELSSSSRMHLPSPLHPNSCIRLMPASSNPKVSPTPSSSSNSNSTSTSSPPSQPGAQPAAAPAPLPPLFVDLDAIERARAAAVAARETGKRPSLPSIIPDFKANPLDIREWFPSPFLPLQRSAPTFHPLIHSHGSLAPGGYRLSSVFGQVKDSTPFSDPSVVLIHSSRLNHSLRAIFFLVTAIPPKVEEALKLFWYIPYSSLSSHPVLRRHVAKK